ncbi:MAG: AbrB/MazE/SpoVT family DNA-binding domain-containing protein [Chloroflexi bacterium]|nr:AbrB/MazE/SpoVT family DNA-binding domain-containing protein [Chloroflexota bacterium]
MPPLKRLSVVQEKGQVTIPTEIRKKLGLKKGDRVSFVETDRGVLISPQEVVALDALEKIGQLLKENGLTLEELMASGRETRGQLIKEKYDEKYDLAEDE